MERPFEQDPLVAVLASTRDTPLEQLRCGQAMQRVLLTATIGGLSASFLSAPTEIPQTRAALGGLIGEHLHVQTVLRLGYGHPTTQTPRRAIDAVTTTSQEPS